MYEAMRAALLAALHYHPVVRGGELGESYKEAIASICQRKKLAVFDGLIGDCFANLYVSVLRLPPDHYYDIAGLFFEDLRFQSDPDNR